MNFAAVITSVQAHLTRRNQPFAIVGGVALAAYGVQRTTLDLDLVVHRSVQDDLIEWLENAGYDTLFRSSGYSNHLHPDSAKGRIDFVYVGDETAEALFSQARQLTGPGDLSLPVVHPNHLAAMKVQALANDPSRRYREIEDLRSLLLRTDVERTMLRRQFTRHGLKELYDALIERL